MKWFKGEIPRAIQTAKAKGSVFIVYITGEDEQSTKMDETWEDGQITAICEQEECVAVKIKAKSDDCSYFSQIYPVVVVPSTFFIGSNGIPVEVTGGYVAPKDFSEKIRLVIQTHKTKSPLPAQTATTAPSGVHPPSVNETAAAESLVEPLAAAATSVESSESGQSQAKKPKIDSDDKVERAKKLVEKQRIEKMRKEEEEAKQKELERVQMGRELTKLRQFQQEREMKETQEQIKKDRDEDRKARERVKEQIARDRAERAARFNKEKAEREKAQEEAKRARLMAQQQVAAEAEARRSVSARLQFRMPDGSSVSQTFPSGEPFQRAIDFASQQMGCSVTLSTTFPRRMFTDSDVEKTFTELRLVPSAVLMVLPGRSRGVPQEGGGVATTGILGLIFAPFVFLFNLLRSLFSSPPPPPLAPSQQHRGGTAAGGDRNSGAYQRRTAAREGGISRTEGKVHRFRNNEDDDDESATWNGNSTQQM